MNPTSYAHCNHNEKGMIFPRIRGGIGKPQTNGEKAMCHLPLSYPTTTIKNCCC